MTVNFRRKESGQGSVKVYKNVRVPGSDGGPKQLHICYLPFRAGALPDADLEKIRSALAKVWSRERPDQPPELEQTKVQANWSRFQQREVSNAKASQSHQRTLAVHRAETLSKQVEAATSAASALRNLVTATDRILEATAPTAEVLRAVRKVDAAVEQCRRLSGLRVGSGQRTRLPDGSRGMLATPGDLADRRGLIRKISEEEVVI